MGANRFRKLVQVHTIYFTCLFSANHISSDISRPICRAMIFQKAVAAQFYARSSKHARSTVSCSCQELWAIKFDQVRSIYFTCLFSAHHMSSDISRPICRAMLFQKPVDAQFHARSNELARSIVRRSSHELWAFKVDQVHTIYFTCLFSAHHMSSDISRPICRAMLF